MNNYIENNLQEYTPKPLKEVLCRWEQLMNIFPELDLYSKPECSGFERFLFVTLISSITSGWN